MRLEQALIQADPAAAREALPEFIQFFQSEPLLLVPDAEGGHPRHILQVRIAQSVLRALLAHLPRLGLLRETYHLLQTARAMEEAQQPHGRGITQFSDLFETAFRATIDRVLEAQPEWGPASTWSAGLGVPSSWSDERALVVLLEKLTEPFLRLWIAHSKTVQLSTVEELGADAEWQSLRSFIQRFGGDLFHPRFMTLANLRGILHRGPANYLDHLRDNQDPLHPVRLTDELDRSIGREEASRHLQHVLQAVLENYEEYKDYNTTTVQSDYGENLHMLLDFLSLKARYERDSWNLQPLVWVHELLVRRHGQEAAKVWQEGVAALSLQGADRLVEEMNHLEEMHGFRLRTIRDRLEERLLQPLALDRICALIEPAMEEAAGRTDRGTEGLKERGKEKEEDGGSRMEEQGRLVNPLSSILHLPSSELTPVFARLQEELRAYAAQPTGVGLDVPAWLQQLEMEVRRVRASRSDLAHLAEQFLQVPKVPLPFVELENQLKEWEKAPG